MGDTAKIFINGNIDSDTYLDVIRQYKSYKNSTIDNIELTITSNGGSVNAGENIANYLLNKNLPITTIVNSHAYSIASYLFVVGDMRVLHSDAELMIHNPHIPTLNNVTAEELEFYSIELRKIEKLLSNHYSKYTSIESEVLDNLMSDTTFLNAEQSKELGFATEILSDKELKIAAHYTINKNENMNKKERNLFELLKNFFSDKQVQNLIVQDAKGTDIDFYELDTDATPKVGDKAKDTDGKIIEGEVTMPTGEIFVFEGGELTEIKPVETETPSEATPEVVNEEVQTVWKYTSEIVEDAPYEVGQQLHYAPYEEGDEPTPVEANEFRVESSGQRFLTDAEGVIQFIFPTEETRNDAVNNLREAYDRLEDEIQNLKKLISSKSIQTNKQLPITNQKVAKTEIPAGIEALANIRKNK